MRLVDTIIRKGKPPVPVVKERTRATFGLDHGPPVSEDVVQISILEWLALVLPDATVIHVPNGGKRSISQAVKFKRLGVKAGVCDLLVFLSGARTIFLEVKTRKGVLSAEQLSFHADMKGKGFFVATVRCVDDVRNALAHAGVRTREAKQ